MFQVDGPSAKLGLWVVCHVARLGWSRQNLIYRLQLTLQSLAFHGPDLTPCQLPLACSLQVQLTSLFLLTWPFALVSPLYRPYSVLIAFSPHQTLFPNSLLMLLKALIIILLHCIQCLHVLGATLPLALFLLPTTSYLCSLVVPAYQELSDLGDTSVKDVRGSRSLDPEHYNPPEVPWDCKPFSKIPTYQTSHCLNRIQWHIVHYWWPQNSWKYPILVDTGLVFPWSSTSVY